MRLILHISLCAAFNIKMQRRIGLATHEKSSLATATRSSVGAVYKLDRTNPWNIGWLADAALQLEVSAKVQPFAPDSEGIAFSSAFSNP